MTRLSAVRLRHLRAFVAVARQASVGRAAAELSITQPAVSKAIRELEQIVGVDLFDRARRGAVLTRFGETFLAHAETSLSALRRGIEEIEDAASPGALPVRVGALPTVSARLLPAAIRSYQDQGLGAVPRVVTGPNHYLTEQLRQGDLDIVIGRMQEPDAMTGLVFEHLYSERLAFAVRAGHPLADAPLRPSALAGFECLLPPPGSVIRPAVDRFFTAHGLRRPARVVETVSLAFSRRYVRASDAVWVISEGVVLEDIEAGELVRLDIDAADTTGPVGVTLRAGVALSFAADVLLREVRRAAAAIRES